MQDKRNLKTTNMNMNLLRHVPKNPNTSKINGYNPTILTRYHPNLITVYNQWKGNSLNPYKITRQNKINSQSLMIKSTENIRVSKIVFIFGNYN